MRVEEAAKARDLRAVGLDVDHESDGSAPATNERGPAVHIGDLDIETAFCGHLCCLAGEEAGDVRSAHDRSQDDASCLHSVVTVQHDVFGDHARDRIDVPPRCSGHEMGVRYRFIQGRSREATLGLSGAVEVGAPLASHAEDLMPNRVLAIADGVEGRAPEWFTPGVTPITASGALRWASATWSLETELRLPLLVRVAEANMPSMTTNTKTLALAAVAGGEARYRLSQRLSLAAGAHLFFDIAPSVAHVRDVSRVQDFERLSLHIHFGSRAALVIDLQAAIAGELGGSTVAGGLRGVVNL